MTANPSNLTPEQRLDAMVREKLATRQGSPATGKSYFMTYPLVAIDLLARLDAAEATIQQQARELGEANYALILACDVDRDPNDLYLAEAYRAAVARRSARAQQDKSEAKKEE